MKLIYIWALLVVAIFAQTLEDANTLLGAKEYKKALKSYELLCKKSVAIACRRASFIYATGIGVAVDSKKSATLAKRACTLEDGRGCTNLATMYALGVGVEANSTKATKLYKKACRLKDVDGCAKVGFAYLKGIGVDKNISKAFELLSSACKQEQQEACYNLAILQDKKGNYKESKKLYEKTCSSGDALACNQLGFLYQNGLGVKKDIGKALHYYIKSCQGGSKMGCENRDYFNDKRGKK